VWILDWVVSVAPSGKGFLGEAVKGATEDMGVGGIVIWLLGNGDRYGTRREGREIKGGAVGALLF